MAEAVRRGGRWIACRPGCCECCIGPFSISHEDAARLREALELLAPERAERVRERARSYVAVVHSYDEDGLPEGMDETPCPALDPESGRCEVYEARPAMCRTFGPAVSTEGAISSCELCFRGASAEEIAACAVEISREDLQLDAPQMPGVAFALA
jgi:Fe-S-cluster containining protein